MTPAELHAEVLAALDAAADAGLPTPAPWWVGASLSPFSPTSIVADDGRRTLARDVPWRDAHLVVALRNTASSAYAAARRIIERHAPMASGRCDHCWGRRRADTVWPCPDYRDAAAMVPNMPKEVADALRR